MALEINAQYTKFVQFAEAEMHKGNEEAIARVSGGPLGGRTITASDTDSILGIFNWYRTPDDIRANDHARALFRRAIIKMFGGSEANIPQNVKDAMELHNFNNEGHPLTARRIMFVKAEVDRIIDDARAFNNWVVGSIMDGTLHELPHNMQDSLKAVVDNLRTVFGAERVPQGAKITDILDPARVQSSLNALASAATAQGRKLGPEELVGAFIAQASTHVATTSAGAHILDRIKAREPNVPFDAQTLGTQYDAAYPGFMDELLNCKNPADVAAAFRRHEADIARFAEVKARGYAAQNAVDAVLAESGVADAKVLKDVRNAMLARVAGELAKPGEFKELGAFLAAVKADAQALAKALDGIARSKASASSVASTTIAAFSGIGMAYVMNNLNINSTTEKLGFLYDDVTAKARSGERIDRTGNLNKANDIVMKFAMNKVDVLKDIDNGGFDPVECEKFKRLALKDFAWKDTDVAAVAKGLAGKESLKQAARLLAVATKGEALEALNDLQLRDVFLTFGKALTSAFNENYGEHAAKWRGIEHIETRRRLFDMVVHLLGKEQPALVESFTRLVLSERFANLKNSIGNGPDGIDAEVCRTAGFLLENIEGTFSPGNKTVSAEKHVASVVKGREIIAKYAGELAQEAIPVFAKLVRGLDWRENKAAESEEVVKAWVEDMKTWRDVVPGSTDAKGLEKVFQRRMTGYLRELLSHPDNFNDGFFSVFRLDLERDSVHFINGRKVRGNTLQEKLVPFRNAFKDPEKLKAVSAVINQQLWGDYTLLCCRMPLHPIKAGMQPDPVNNIPGIEKFVSRDVMETGMQTLGTGQMVFKINISPDENIVTVTSTSDYPINGDFAMGGGATIGKCKVSQSLVIDFTGAEPEIRDYKVGQALE